ncbi:MAG: SufS family cysteine desulfurase, partial [Kangiellaceae bacterium]|nr:SufS family cysteine desulfurase [Kangiellaceae bacterium]
MNSSKNTRLDVSTIRKDFPILSQQVNGSDLIYFDNGATAQKPQQVIDAISHYYQTTNSNVHRGAHYLSDKATQEFENARSLVQKFIGANSREEVIWTRGTTEAINLVAQTWGRTNIKAGDEIIISTLEHHSNIVPWQILCEQNDASLKVIQLTENAEIDLEHYQSLLSSKTKLVAIGHISNALGVINPIKEIIKSAHSVGAAVLIDGAQAMPHIEIDVTELDCDFYAFSGHKMFAPMGIGVLYGKKELLNEMPPWQAGGEMIEKVSFEKTTFNQLPYKFEAGTPNVAGAIGLAAAINYLNNLDRSAILRYENELRDYATSKLKILEGMNIVAENADRASVISFNIDNCHSQDIGM